MKGFSDILKIDFFIILILSGIGEQRAKAAFTLRINSLQVAFGAKYI